MITLIWLAAISGGCTPRLDKRHYSPYTYRIEHRLSGDMLRIELGNPLACPLRVFIRATESADQHLLAGAYPVTLPSNRDTTLVITGLSDRSPILHYESLLGDVSQTVHPADVRPPFPVNRSYRVLQGNNSDFTHDNDFARYAVDFDMLPGDTVCAAAGGIVVGVVQDYRHGGAESEWRSNGNYLTVYNPETGVFNQYVHLTQGGSLVRIGDTITAGQAIALSGNTGQTTRPHLHFSCLIPTAEAIGLRSVPHRYISGQDSRDLVPGDVLGAEGRQP